jgi:hypothetical protein
VVEVRMREKHVTDLAQLGEREITEAGSGIDQYVIVDQDGRSAQTRADSAAAS